MAEHAKSIDISDVPEILRLAEEVRRAGEPRVLAKGGEELAMVVPLLPPRKRRRGRVKTEADYKAFRSAAGGWADVDTDTLIKNIYEDRRRSSRPPVEL
jgi:antitoxin (DNA-binding transcriptional repressor) of toxin-antitoxin stability system